MVIGIIGIVVGLLVLGAGLYYLLKEKNDPESKKIYSITSAGSSEHKTPSGYFFAFFRAEKNYET